MVPIIPGINVVKFIASFGSLSFGLPILLKYTKISISNHHPAPNYYIFIINFSY